MMIDEHSEELLSRHLDGDLSGAELRSFEARLDSEEDLRAALEDLRAVQSGIGDLATAMEPPAELDALMEPLRRGRGGGSSRRTMMVLLSAAACVALGFAVVQQMRHRGPLLEPPGNPPQVAVGPGADEGYYQLQPLPTAVPGSEVLGAAERLMASPVPDLEVPDAEPLHVIGPLSEEERGSDAPSAGEASGQRPASSADGFEDRREVSEPPALEPASRTASAKTADTGFAPIPERRMALEVESTVCAVHDRLDVDLPAGRYPVRITVAEGRITHCASHSPRPDTFGADVCRAVSALAVPSLARGTVDALAIVSDLER